MAATHQRHPRPNKQLEQFLAAGEAELSNLDEPERTIRAQSLFAEMRRRFQPGTSVAIADFNEPPSAKDVEDAVIQRRQDREENERTHADDEEGDGESSDHFRSHLQVKCMDNATAHPVVIHRGPDVQVIGPLAAKPDPVELVGEGEIRFEERGYADYKPTRPYHDRVSSWMFSLQNPSDSRRKRSKQQLICEFCGEDFEGRKGQKYCSENCSKHRQPRLVKEENEYGALGCEKAFELFLQLRLEYLMQKHGVEELTNDMTLDALEKHRLTDLAVYMVKEISNEQQ